MTFTITQEAFDVVPEKSGFFGKSKPAPFGLDALEVGNSAFIPLTAFPAAERDAQISTSKGCSRLGSYITSMFKGHRDLKGRKIAFRREGLGVRVYRLS
ncbi:MAG: hypothetical protein ACRCYS_18665 [Beijerinckiaceae bacterium]